MEAVGIESPEFVLLPENKEYHTVVQFVKVNRIIYIVCVMLQKYSSDLCICYRLLSRQLHMFVLAVLHALQH